MIRMPGEGELWRSPFGDTVTWLVGEEGTGGGFALLERVAPVGARSQPHRHKRIEAFYVTDGEFELTVGDRTTRGGAGTLSSPETARRTAGLPWEIVRRG